MAAAVIVFAAVALERTAPAQALTNCTVSDITVDSEEARFLTLINNYRAQNGRAALQMSTNLNRAATWMVVDLATKNYFSHTDSSGRSPTVRAQDCGYPGGAGENLAAGTLRDTAQEAFDAWRASSGHNANMLNSSYRMIGIARYYRAGSTYGWYWATNFGLVNDGTSGGSGSPATPTPTKTPTPAAVAVPATIASPAPGSTLPGAVVSFQWSAASGALEYFFYAGTSLGSNNLYGKSMGLNRSVTLTNLPTNGSTVYVRVWTRFATGWQYRDVTFKAALASATPTATPALETGSKAALTSPAPGSTFPGTSVTFIWTGGAGALEYFLYLGTSPGSNNLFGASMGTSRSVTLNGLPRGGAIVYLRLWTRSAAGWQYNDYWFRLAP
jgi:uncharacterized protein YkwD